MAIFYRVQKVDNFQMTMKALSLTTLSTSAVFLNFPFSLWKQLGFEFSLRPFSCLSVYREGLDRSPFVLQLFSQMLAEKEENWNAYRKECVERMAELSEVFSGAKALSRVEKNSK